MLMKVYWGEEREEGREEGREGGREGGREKGSQHAKVGRAEMWKVV